MAAPTAAVRLIEIQRYRAASGWSTKVMTTHPTTKTAALSTDEQTTNALRFARPCAVLRANTRVVA